MYTQCPQCQAIFQVTAEHLKAANGDVRCGQCLTVFNALDNLSEELPAESYEGEEAAPAGAPDSGTEPPADWAPPPEFPEPGTAAEAEPEEMALGDMDTAVVDLGEYLAAEDVAEGDAEHIESIEAPAEAPVESLAGEGEAPTPSEPVAASVTEPASEPATAAVDEAPKTIQVPSVILDDLAREKAERLRPSNMPWAVGSMALMLVFLLQAVYFARDDLARDPALRPWLETACSYVGCTLSRPAATDQIEILGWDVRSHPTAPKALVASTTLINNAPFAQPFPLLELRFSDITGTPLAQRRFKPREYLPAGTDFQAGMRPDTPLHVELELMDPGSAAVNFEFHAVTDPGTASHRS